MKSWIISCLKRTLHDIWSETYITSRFRLFQTSIIITFISIFWKILSKLLKNPPNFANLTHSVSTIIFPLCKFQTFKCNLYLMIFTFILKNLPKIWKNSPNCKLSAKNELPMIKIWKWCITSWYTVKPDFCQFLPDFSGKNRIPDPENRIPDPEIY